MSTRATSSATLRPPKARDTTPYTDLSTSITRIEEILLVLYTCTSTMVGTRGGARSAITIEVVIDPQLTRHAGSDTYTSAAPT